ncbi:hypothetical protein [Streptomyces sp. WMMC1477]|uniref:hypothetical protein n=1 Tax=Streptomyces sp. WMMC1477 TaxID=3015155 RepID=UPI0022B67C4A|nr:hypothetical protein [Streptomyces sp. WMMC1477]MCZ7430156.1 hypothetical protein [Streptomyces sp. WMMC1477]MCZ7430169.1 hypothetical protein [Streptomyces sp. WMMC1477]
MALDYDSRRAARDAATQKTLVEAVRRASAADEKHWLEWKSTLDFQPKNKADKHGRAHVARAIIGFANRMPDDAEQDAEGYGHLVVGADPDGYHGVIEHDRVELHKWITDFVGDRIRWDCTYVHITDEAG